VAGTVCTICIVAGTVVQGFVRLVLDVQLVLGLDLYVQPVRVLDVHYVLGIYLYLQRFL
jgi:hypothetical protein